MLHFIKISFLTLICLPKVWFSHEFGNVECFFGCTKCLLSKSTQGVAVVVCVRVCSCRRGKPLYLSVERYQLLQQQWTTHAFDHTSRRWVWHKDNL